MTQPKRRVWYPNRFFKLLRFWEIPQYLHQIYEHEMSFFYYYILLFTRLMHLFKTSQCQCYMHNVTIINRFSKLKPSTSMPMTHDKRFFPTLASSVTDLSQRSEPIRPSPPTLDWAFYFCLSSNIIFPFKLLHVAVKPQTRYFNKRAGTYNYDLQSFN